MITVSVKPAGSHRYTISPKNLRAMKDVHKIYYACSPYEPCYVHEYKNKNDALDDIKYDLVTWRAMVLNQKQKISDYRNGSYLNRKMKEYREQLQQKIQESLSNENKILQEREKIIQLSQKSVYDIEKLPQDGKKVFIIHPIDNHHSFPFETVEYYPDIKYQN